MRAVVSGLAVAGWVGTGLAAVISRSRLRRRSQLLQRLRTGVGQSGGPAPRLPAEVSRAVSSLRWRTVAQLLYDGRLPADVESAVCVELLAGPGERRYIRYATGGRSRSAQRRRILALRVLLSGASPAALNHLEAALDDHDPTVVAAVVSLLGRSPDRRAADTLSRRLRLGLRDSPAVARALDRFPADVLELVEPLVEDARPRLRALAALLLRRYASNGRVEQHLVDLCSDPDPHVRLSALGAISAAGGPAAQQMAQQLLTDTAGFVRARAALALAALRVTGAAWRLALLLGDREWNVRAAARDALTALGPAAAHVLGPSLASDDPFVREGAASVVSRLKTSGPEVVASRALLAWRLDGVAALYASAKPA